MITLKNLTIKNFLSVGNIPQTINLNSNDLTLVLGQNSDLSEDSMSNRNGSGKCLHINTIVKIRNQKTGEIFSLTIGELYELAKKREDEN